MKISYPIPVKEAKGIQCRKEKNVFFFNKNDIINLI